MKHNKDCEVQGRERKEGGLYVCDVGIEHPPADVPRSLPSVMMLPA